MHIEVSGRQTGKTTKMIDEVVKNQHATIITHSQMEGNRLEDLLDEKFHGWIWWRDHYDIHTWDDLVRGSLHGGLSKPVYIDNLDLILSQYGIVWASASSTEEY